MGTTESLDDCFSLIQPSSPASRKAAPLVLIHDGGGTSVSYYFLGSLDRAVYGLRNPKFYTGGEWKGGILEMAHLYADFITTVIPSGPLLLGGWSFGGILSLEIANILKRSSDVQVLGIVMIDSMFIGATSQWGSLNVVPPQLCFAPETRQDTKQNVCRSMDQAVDMLQQWVPPVWSGNHDEQLCHLRHEFERLWIHSESDGGDDPKHQNEDLNGLVNSDAEKTLPSLPNAVLLRCEDYAPVSKTTAHDAISRADLTRQYKKLGWENYRTDLIETVLDISGHHFNLFAEEYIDDLTAHIKQACNLLDRRT